MKKFAIYLSVALIAGLLGFITARSVPGSNADSTGSTGGSTERQPLYWVAPMDSSFRRDEPGLSPMGMDLIPVYEEPDAETSAVRVNPLIQQNLGLRTARVESVTLSRDIETVGYTRWNEASIEMLHPRAEGWLEVLNLTSVGDPVGAGQIIYELYAPTLVSAQQEFITARQAGNETLAALARERLMALGYTAEQVNRLVRQGSTSSRLVYRASEDAVVLSLGTRPGNFVQPATTIATLASLDTVWVDVEVFESDAAAITVGLNAKVEFPAFPGQVWSGEVAHVYPELDPETRTLRVRLLIDNEDHRLKPNMFTNVSIAVSPRSDVLAVPREAIIRSGSGARVIVMRENNEFEPRAVVTGISSVERIEILQGLSEGETVVTSGQFLLDAEANGEQALARLDATADSLQDSMQGMDMEMAIDMRSDADMSEPTEAVYSTVGQIVAMADAGVVTLAHQPVPALNWPAMTMSFSTTPELDLAEFAVDDSVRVEFRQLDDGSFQIEHIANAEDGQ